MSSGEDDSPPISDDSYGGYESSPGQKEDKPLPDESEPSYDGYRRSSSEEEGDAIYPVDDIAIEDDVLGDLSSLASFPTDKFPVKLILSPAVRHMSGQLQALNREGYRIMEQSRGLLNQIYRTDSVLKQEPCYERVLQFKYDSFTALRGLRPCLESVVQRLAPLGGPYYCPSSNLWKYLHFFWYDKGSDSTMDNNETPVPLCEPPEFLTKYGLGNGNLGAIMNALKEEQFGIAPGLDKGEVNLALLEQFNSLKLKAEEYWKIHKDDLLLGSTTGLYAEVVQMDQMIKDRIAAVTQDGQKCCIMPFLLHRAIWWFKEKSLVG